MEQKPPQEVTFILRVTGTEEYHLKKEPRHKRDFFSWLFNTNVASGAMTGGRYGIATEERGVLDHSGIQAVLEKVDALREKQKKHLEDYADKTERLKGFAYTTDICAELWVGPTPKMNWKTSDDSKIRPGDVWRLQNVDISAKNLQAILKICDTAETRALNAASIDNAVAQAVAPVGNPKLMKTLKVKKPV